MIAVLQEMGARGDEVELRKAVARYLALSEHPFLETVDQVRARMWAGSALAKLRQGPEALALIGPAQRWLVDNRVDIVGSHLKLAAANLACTELRWAERADRADGVLEDLAAKQQSLHLDPPVLLTVRRKVCQAHILLARKRSSTTEEGLELLRTTQSIAVRYGLNHQLRKINESMGAWSECHLD
ncbi:hypothetical protein [Geodermatophilus normandii]|uniref:Uncharacterized protein n=1 Tax=Geodermatophilus normandii TaxID=1137989 RepID=A0A6P0GKL2_9ACTN|nr:hypothetical protein [Geodermatophilus normandii]NEM07913.1 hypothetical protein [Geodermatophilus normandii]